MHILLYKYYIYKLIIQLIIILYEQVGHIDSASDVHSNSLMAFCAADSVSTH